jgi:hypothetical protein
MELSPDWWQYLMMFSTPPGMLRQLYVMAPVCTPPKFESGTGTGMGAGADSFITAAFSTDPGTILRAASAVPLPTNLRLDNFIFSGLWCKYSIFIVTINLSKTSLDY